MSNPNYALPAGGLPPQSQKLSSSAVFTEAYAFIPRSVMTDIVTSLLPHWERTRAWIIARPLTGFSETFAQYVMEVAPGGGSSRPEPDSGVEGAFFVTDGMLDITYGGQTRRLEAGGFAFLPAGLAYSVANAGTVPACFHWIRKAFEAVDGIGQPDPVFTTDRETQKHGMPDTDGRWATSRFIDPADIRYDMHVNIVTFEAGAVIPFLETHVMEHGLYVLEGKAVYRLNRDWVEVEAGDFMWLRAFCPQACYAGGPGQFRYLLYKDVNRHAHLGLTHRGRGRTA